MDTENTESKTTAEDDVQRRTVNALVMRIFNVTAKYNDYDEIWWRTDGEYAPVTMIVNCNDLFFWACADAEAITAENIDEFEQAYEDAAKADEHGACYAALLFCCRVRKMRPQTPYYKHIPEPMHELFNACGPKRINA